MTIGKVSVPKTVVTTPKPELKSPLIQNPVVTTTVPQGWTAKGGGTTRPVSTPPATTTAQAAGGKKIDNGFNIALSGGDPVATGSFLNQTKQGLITADLGLRAGMSIVSGGRLPPDFVKNALLRSLDRIPPIEGQPTAKAVYTSHAKCAPKTAYDQFVKNPGELFGAAGLKLRPPVTELKDGARTFIEDKGPPPVWAPVEFKLDPKNNKVTVTTLDGHPLRGTNEFHFKSDGKGGTNFVQTSHFQGSSPLVELGKKTGAIDRQHGIWEAIHQNIASLK